MDVFTALKKTSSHLSGPSDLYEIIGSIPFIQGDPGFGWGPEVAKMDRQRDHGYA